MADKKITKREILEGIKAIVAENPDAQDYVEFLDKEIATLDARAEKAREKRAEKKNAGDELTEAVYAEIEKAEGAIAPQDIADALAGEYEDITKNKVTYRAGQLIKEGRVFKIQVKGEDGRKTVAYTVEAPEDDAE